jgi:hypothetical protein
LIQPARFGLLGLPPFVLIGDSVRMSLSGGQCVVRECLSLGPDALVTRSAYIQTDAEWFVESEETVQAGAVTAREWYQAQDGGLGYPYLPMSFPDAARRECTGKCFYQGIGGEIEQGNFISQVTGWLGTDGLTYVEEVYTEDYPNSQVARYHRQYCYGADGLLRYLDFEWPGSPSGQIVFRI